MRIIQRINIIIGKASGPYCYTITKDNFNNPEKSYIAIANQYIFAFYSEFSRADRILITNNEEIYDVINEEINKKYTLFINEKYIKNLSISRSGNKINFISLADLYNVEIRSHIDLNGDGSFDPAYSALFKVMSKKLFYFFIISRQVTTKSKIKLQFVHYEKIIHEIIL